MNKAIRSSRAEFIFLANKVKEREDLGESFDLRGYFEKFEPRISEDDWRQSEEQAKNFFALRL